VSDTVVTLADDATLAEATPQTYRVRLPGTGWQPTQAARLAEQRVREHFRAGGRGALLIAPRGELVPVGIERTGD
jgi:hypothetical protein